LSILPSIDRKRDSNRDEDEDREEDGDEQGMEMKIETLLSSCLETSNPLGKKPNFLTWNTNNWLQED
jgi:hypothetical protein